MTSRLPRPDPRQDVPLMTSRAQRDPRQDAACSADSATRKVRNVFEESRRQASGLDPPVTRVGSSTPVVPKLALAPRSGAGTPSVPPRQPVMRSLLRLETVEGVVGELRFSESRGAASVMVINQSGGTVAFKIKTTAPKDYLVKPSSGVLQMGAELAVEISSVNPIVGTAVHAHRFCFQAAQIGSSTESPLKREQWAILPRESIEEFRFQAVWEAPSTDSSEDSDLQSESQSTETPLSTSDSSQSHCRVRTPSPPPRTAAVAGGQVSGSALSRTDGRPPLAEVLAQLDRNFETLTSMYREGIQAARELSEPCTRPVEPSRGLPATSLQAADVQQDDSSDTSAALSQYGVVFQTVRDAIVTAAPSVAAIAADAAVSDSPLAGHRALPDSETPHTQASTRQTPSKAAPLADLAPLATVEVEVETVSAPRIRHREVLRMPTRVPPPVLGRAAVHPPRRFPGRGRSPEPGCVIRRPSDGEKPVVTPGSVLRRVSDFEQAARSASANSRHPETLGRSASVSRGAPPPRVSPVNSADAAAAIAPLFLGFTAAKSTTARSPSVETRQVELPHSSSLPPMSAADEVHVHPKSVRDRIRALQAGGMHA